MSDFFLVRPIDLWPEPETRTRTRSPFSATYSATKALLHREITALGATSAILQLAVTETDIRLDGDLRATARPSHPGVIVSFESRHGPDERLRVAMEVARDTLAWSRAATDQIAAAGRGRP